MPKVSGSCLCGSVSFEGEGDIAVMANCHCTDCQKATGAAFAAMTFFKEDDISISGELNSYEHVADSGSRMTKLGCPKCGSPMFGKNTARAGMIAVRAGAMDQKELFQPMVNVYCSSAIPSTALNGDLKNFDKMPG